MVNIKINIETVIMIMITWLLIIWWFKKVFLWLIRILRLLWFDGNWKMIHVDLLINPFGLFCIVKGFFLSWPMVSTLFILSLSFSLFLHLLTFTKCKQFLILDCWLLIVVAFTWCYCNNCCSRCWFWCWWCCVFQL